MAGEFDDIRKRLESISEELADLAMERLRESIDAGGVELPVDERRLDAGPPRRREGRRPASGTRRHALSRPAGLLGIRVLAGRGRHTFRDVRGTLG